MTLASRPVPIGLIALLVACSPDRKGGAGGAAARVDTVSDTITVITNGPGRWGPNPRVVQRLALTERTDDKNYEFGRIRDLVVDQNGSMIVYDNSLSSIRQYDSSGKFIRRIGRVGDGPGEYRDIEGLAITPDHRLLAYDFRGQYIHVYDSTGAPLQRLGPIDSRLGGRENTLMVGSTGKIFVAMALTPQTPDPAVPPRFGFFVADSTGKIIDTIFQPEPRVRNASPYSAHQLWTLGPHGDTVTVISSDRYLVTVLRGTKPILRFGRQDVPPIAVTEAEKDAIKKAFEEERRLYAGQGPDMGAIPSVKPAIRAIRVAEDGRIWVSPHVPSIENTEPVDTTVPIWNRPPRWSEPPVWDVFEADGRFLGRLEFPARAQILRSRGPEAWGVLPDENDVPKVVRWAIGP